MPIPKPKFNEGETQFMGRCMADANMGEYPQEQRLAVCQTSWDDKAKVGKTVTLKMRTVRKHGGGHGFLTRAVHGTHTWKLRAAKKGDTPVYVVGAKPVYKEGRHSRFACMKCDAAPVWECLWAEGMGHAWFCAVHKRAWLQKDGKGEVVSERDIDGEASKNYRHDPVNKSIARWVVDEAADEDGMLALYKSATRQYTFGPVYLASDDKTDPVFDAHREFIMDEELQKAQWDYVRSGDRNIYKQHGMLPEGMTKLGEWVDLVSWPHDVQANLTLPGGSVNKVMIPAGSVWMGIVWNAEGWQLVKSGAIRGMSMGGSAKRLDMFNLMPKKIGPTGTGVG